MRATPIPPRRADGFLLGASLESARLAAQLDWNFVFAAHLNGDKALLREVLTRWRTLSRRDAIIAVQAIVAEDSAAARDLAQQVEVWGVELENGQRVTVGSEAQGIAFARQGGQRPDAYRPPRILPAGPVAPMRSKRSWTPCTRRGELTNSSSIRRSPKVRRVSTLCACWLRPIRVRRCCDELC
ncbi:luciferase family oxidoreductase, group 1 [Raoultella terrigena]|uniref:Luciferase family oxidoreductase, group 1 n=1 Tax=Raoultella terrigena TaxID=577 RepID=A0A3P8KLF1_RAOTE|nr:luciferase family oxidoreductase, group 1 [Raoultella terrigena]